MLWRWHFYAGLFCIPFIILLSITGSLYLFKPQIEAALDRPYTNLVMTGPSAPVSQQVQVALKHVEDSSFKSYRLPDGPKDAAQVLVTKGGEDTIVYVHPTSLEILKAIPREARLMAVVRTIHGELLMGDNGSLIVELAASWAIVMVVTGLYLWWPRTAEGLQGVLIPRLKSGPKVFWRDLHAVSGMWVSFFALFLLLTGLPWTNVWGKGFDMVLPRIGPKAGRLSAKRLNRPSLTTGMMRLIMSPMLTILPRVRGQPDWLHLSPSPRQTPEIPIGWRAPQLETASAASRLPLARQMAAKSAARPLATSM